MSKAILGPKHRCRRRAPMMAPIRPTTRSRAVRRTGGRRSCCGNRLDDRFAARSARIRRERHAGCFSLARSRDSATRSDGSPFATVIASGAGIPAWAGGACSSRGDTPSATCWRWSSLLTGAAPRACCTTSWDLTQADHHRQGPCPVRWPSVPTEDGMSMASIRIRK
jgi:hypothetical protein